MEDNSGKKFSLQDWVMKRAANQSGVVVPPISERQDVSARAEEDAVERIERESPSHEESRFEIHDPHPLVRPMVDARDAINATATLSMEDDSNDANDQPVEVAMKVVSNGSAIPSIPPQTAKANTDKPLDKSPLAPPDRPADPYVAQRREEIKEEIREALLSSLAASAVASAVKESSASNGAGTPLTSFVASAIQNATQNATASAPAPSATNGQAASASTASQQNQMMRVLSEMNDRLRQTEKEREVLWKELELCRKQIADMSAREDKAEKTFTTLETQINQREVFVKELVEKQIGLEQQLKDQLAALDNAKQEQAKVQDKVNSIETAAGSALVRVEDAIAENEKLTKRVEQLGQDKARLIRKLEVMEETLVQTQETLRAKALVLLTDQSVAAKTALPQTPAWTGDDTLKVAQAMNNKQTQSAGPVSDIAASLKPNHRYAKGTILGMRVGTAAFVGLILLGVVGGVVGSQYFKGSFSTPLGQLEQIQKNLKEGVEGKPLTANEEEAMMQEAARLANEIEPEAVDAQETDAPPLTSSPSSDESFLPAQEAQDKAVADFKSTAPKTALANRIQRDRNLPPAIAAIQTKAFAGDANAQHDLAAIYTAGQGNIKVNYPVAARWFEEAAQNGIPNAQYNLGVLYHQGLGVKKDTAKAIQLYRVAASNAHPEAQYNLGIAYIEGVGVEYNPAIAAHYFEKAAEGGIVEAAYNLGLLHENGLMGESQPDEALFWYSLAAKAGSPDADKALTALNTKLNMTPEDVAQNLRKMVNDRPVFKNAAGDVALPPMKRATPAVPKAPDATVTTTDSASSVKPAVDTVVLSQIQEQLIRFGLYKGTPNGELTPSLEQAIKTYQQKNGMKIDGQPSDDLLVQMLASGVESAAGN